MKLILITLLIVITPFFTNKILSNTEVSHYTLIAKLGNVEIREFKNLIYASHTPLNDIDRNNSFRNIASYIFRENNRDEKIEMTSPVIIKLHNQNEMAFIMPKKYTINSLPKPNNNKIKLYEEKSSTKACITYSGYSNNNTEKAKIQALKKTLKKHNIKHKNDFEVLVYNSPWKFINRRNEITVSVEYEIQRKSDMDTVYLGGGCFWCTEAVFEDVIGVKAVKNGYAGGKIKNPSYREVSKGKTKHAEVCEIIYDTKQILLKDLLKIFFLSHDPTTLNRQGNDIGEHYRSIIFYKSNKEKIIIKDFINKINTEVYDNKIVTEVQLFKNFYEAEEYHQNYYKDNKSASYCKLVISPKVIQAKKELKKYYQY